VEIDSPGSSTNLALKMLVELIHQRTGLSFDNSRLDLISSKISTILQASNFSSLLDYYYFLKYDNSADDEWFRLQSALAVNETYFWREYDAIRATAEEIVPRLLRDRPYQPVRIWHSACASGEEPYTLAIALEEAGNNQKDRIIIDATDFNHAALAQARSGLYKQRSFRRIPTEILSSYFAHNGQGRYQLNEDIRKRVNFSYMNLMDEASMGQMRNYDIIFCRNVFIYFSDAAIRQVTNWFYRSLNTSGYLFVAAAESLLRITHLYELVEVQDAFAYQKRLRSNDP
jgi:chemotaxis protein methyltransferase CheR